MKNHNQVNKRLQDYHEKWLSSTAIPSRRQLTATDVMDPVIQMGEPKRILERYLEPMVRGELTTEAVDLVFMHLRESPEDAALPFLKPCLD